MSAVLTVVAVALAGPVLLVALALALSAALPGTRPPLRARAARGVRGPAAPAHPASRPAAPSVVDVRSPGRPAALHR